MSNHSVLVVDDDSTVRELLKYRLGKQHKVRAAENGKEALALVQEEHPDLILSDIMMPSMDGITLKRELDSNIETRVIPFIFLTARADEEAHKKGVHLGADDYITKPFDMDRVLIRVSRLLERVDYYRGNVDEEEGSQKPLNVFLSHGKEDSDRVAEVYDALEKHGVNPWMDKKDLLPGQDWEAEIRKAIRRSHVVIVFLSESSVDRRGYFQKEIKIALDMSLKEPEGAIFLIPVRLEKCFVPEPLSDSHWLDLFRSDPDLDTLLQALEQRASALDGVRSPAPSNAHLN